MTVAVPVAPASAPRRHWQRIRSDGSYVLRNVAEALRPGPARKLRPQLCHLPAIAFCQRRHLASEAEEQGGLKGRR